MNLVIKNQNQLQFSQKQTRAGFGIEQDCEFDIEYIEHRILRLNGYMIV